MYSIKIHNRVKKALLRSPAHIICQKFRQIVKELKRNPYTANRKIRKLQKPAEGYCYKSPPFRLLYTIDKKRKIVYVYDFFRRNRGYR